MPKSLPPKPAHPPAAPDPAPAAGEIVRAARHIDDAAQSGRSYRPGDVIAGWSRAKARRYEAAGLVTIEGVL